MKAITEISMQKHSAKHCNLYLDGVFYCGLRIETVVENRLKVGMSVEEKDIDKMQIDSEFTHALDRAMTYLSGAVKTKKQVRDYLLKKGYTQALCDKVLDKLTDYRFLDDEYYATRYLEVAKGKGKYLLARELKARGIEDKTAQKALEDFTDDFESAMSIAQKAIKGKEITRENLSKVYRKLLSRGFGYDTCDSVIEKLKEDDDR